MNQSILLPIFLLLIVLPHTTLGDACSSEYYGYDLSYLARSYDYETQEFTYLGLDWVIVYNFCQNTIRTCAYNHFAAYTNAPNRGLRCSPTFTSGEWYDATVTMESSYTST